MPIRSAIKNFVDEIKDKEITKVDFPAFELTVEEIAELKKAFKNQNSVREINFAVKNINSSRHPQEFIDFLGYLFEKNAKSLETINLSGNLIANALPELARRIGDENCVKNLNLANNDITENQLLSLNVFKKLENLDLSDNNIGDTGVIKLNNVFDNLKTLNLRNTNLSDKAVILISNKLKNNDSLENIYLEGNENIKVDGLSYFIEAIQTNFSLIEIIVDSNYHQLFLNEVTENNKILKYASDKLYENLIKSGEGAKLEPIDELNSLSDEEYLIILNNILKKPPIKNKTNKSLPEEIKLLPGGEKILNAVADLVANDPHNEKFSHSFFNLFRPSLEDFFKLAKVVENPEESKAPTSGLPKDMTMEIAKFLELSDIKVAKNTNSTNSANKEFSNIKEATETETPSTAVKDTKHQNFAKDSACTIS